MNTTPARTPAGSPEGGQFAAAPGAESVTNLEADATPRLSVTFYLQQWNDRDEAVTLREQVVDVTDILTEMTPDERRAALDPYDYGERLFHAAATRGQLDHTGPFDIDLDDISAIAMEDGDEFWNRPTVTPAGPLDPGESSRVLRVLTHAAQLTPEEREFVLAKLLDQATAPEPVEEAAP